VDEGGLAELLKTAFVNGDDASAEALLAVGPSAVTVFHDWRTQTIRLELPKTPDPRWLFDHMSYVSGRLGARFPEEYAQLFADSRWIEDTFVLVGLGYTRRAEAEAILIEALFSGASEFTRLSAASSLRHFPTPEANKALLGALDDPDYLVQYHAIRSLGAVGGREALERLLQLAADPPGRAAAHVVPSAIRSIADRLGLEVEMPTSEKWPHLEIRLSLDD